MAVRPQAPQPEERHYKIGTLNKWFAIGSIVLLITGAIRELFGAGKLLGYTVLPVVTEGGWYYPNGIMVTSAGAFFIIGFLIWGLRAWKPDQVEEEG